MLSKRTMNLRAAAAIVLLILLPPGGFSAPRHRMPAAPTTQTFQSPNGKFSLTLDQSSPSRFPPAMESQYTATMSTNTAAGLEALWSKSITGPPLQFLVAGNIHVSDDGDFFITINYHKDRELVLHRNRMDDLVLKPPPDGYSYFQSLPQWL